MKNLLKAAPVMAIIAMLSGCIVEPDHYHHYRGYNQGYNAGYHAAEHMPPPPPPRASW